MMNAFDDGNRGSWKPDCRQMMARGHAPVKENAGGERRRVGRRPRRGAPQKFVHDFAAAWNEVMNPDRFDVRSISAEKAVA